MRRGGPRVPPAAPSKPDEIAVARLVAGVLVSACERWGVDRTRFDWTLGVRVAPNGRRSIEVLIPAHPSDPRSLFDPAVVRLRLPVLGRHLPCTSQVRLDAEVGELSRHLRHERTLIAAGLDPIRPPAAVYSTDLVTRRALQGHDVDMELLAASAPRPIRSARRIWRDTGRPGCRVGRSRLDSREPSSALPADFPPFLAHFRFCVVRTQALVLGEGVRVRPGHRVGEVLVVVNAVWPATILGSIAGMRLNDVVGHPAFDDGRLVIAEASSAGGTVRLTVACPMVPLVDVAWTDGAAAPAPAAGAVTERTRW
jgi:hypothetical protein